MDTTIFFGNGVNLIGNNGVSWDKLLESISQRKQLLSISSYTLRYESIVVPMNEITPAVLRDKYGRRFLDRDGKVLCTSENTETFVLKQKIANMLDEIEPSYYYQKLADLNANHYVTTNYELSLVQEFKTRKNEIDCIDDKSPLFKHFIIHKDGKMSSIWNIHGDIVHPQSIIIGYADYSNYTAKVHRILETNRRLKKSWINLILNTNVHILGYGLAIDETDMWDILVYRARMIRHTGKQSNEIIYYLICEGKRKKEMRMKRLLLESLKVTVVVIPYEGSFEHAYQIIYKRIKDTMK